MNNQTLLKCFIFSIVLSTILDNKFNFCYKNMCLKFVCYAISTLKCFTFSLLLNDFLLLSFTKFQLQSFFKHVNVYLQNWWLENFWCKILCSTFYLRNSFEIQKTAFQKAQHLRSNHLRAQFFLRTLHQDDNQSSSAGVPTCTMDRKMFGARRMFWSSWLG